MRTTITLDADVAARLEALQRERGVSFKEAVNETLRRGLGRAGAGESTRYRMPTKPLGIRSGIDVDRIRGELAREDDQRFLSGRDAAA